MRKSRSTAWLMGLTFLVGCSGPGDDLPRQAVSGSVTLDGQPFPKGRISFEPAGGGPGTQVGSPVAEGAYDIPAEAGPVPGKYVVRIQGAAEEGDPDDQAKKVKLKPDPIPARYNTRSELQVDVKADGANTMDFDLKSK